MHAVRAVYAVRAVHAVRAHHDLRLQAFRFFFCSQKLMLSTQSMLSASCTDSRGYIGGDCVWQLQREHGGSTPADGWGRKSHSEG